MHSSLWREDSHSSSGNEVTLEAQKFCMQSTGSRRPSNFQWRRQPGKAGLNGQFLALSAMTHKGKYIVHRNPTCTKIWVVINCKIPHYLTIDKEQSAVYCKTHPDIRDLWWKMYVLDGMLCLGWNIEEISRKKTTFIMCSPLWYWLLCSAAAAAAKSLQSCLTLGDPIDGSPLGSSVSGILQARILF